MSRSRPLNIRQLINIIPEKILNLKSSGYSLLMYDVKEEEGKIYNVTEEKQDSGDINYVIDTENVIEEITHEDVTLPIKNQIIENIISTRVDFCKGPTGSVSTSYILGRSSGIHANDNVMLLINHSDKDFSSFIIGSANTENRVKYYYIDIICGNPKIRGQAAVLLSIAINFITNIMGIKVIVLSALEHVISYYPKFGFMFIKDKRSCSPDTAVLEGMTKLNPEIKGGKVVGYKKDEAFTKFLYLLTSLGFNSKNDTWCSAASAIGLSTSVEDVENSMKNPASIDRNSSLIENENLMNSYRNYSSAVSNYGQEKIKPSPNQDVLTQNAKQIIQYAFEYAHQLFEAGGCTSDGFKMTRCANDSGKKRKAPVSSVSTRSKRVR